MKSWFSWNFRPPVSKINWRNFCNFERIYQNHLQFISPASFISSIYFLFVSTIPAICSGVRLMTAAECYFAIKSKPGIYVHPALSECFVDWATWLGYTFNHSVQFSVFVGRWAVLLLQGLGLSLFYFYWLSKKCIINLRKHTRTLLFHSHAALLTHNNAWFLTEGLLPDS